MYLCSSCFRERLAGTASTMGMKARASVKLKQHLMPEFVRLATAPDPEPCIVCGARLRFRLASSESFAEVEEGHEAAVARRSTPEVPARLRLLTADRLRCR